MTTSRKTTRGSNRRKLSDLALEKGLVDQEQLRKAEETQRKLKDLGLEEGLGPILLKLNFITENMLKELEKESQSDVRRLGKNYEVFEKLGHGAMGVVFRARQISMDRIVALKILSPEYANDKSFIERFVREARAAGQFSHENIVTAVDVGHAKPYYYFVMEYVDGVNLKDRIRKSGPIPENEAVTYALMIAKGLRHALEKGIVHRDVKPENVIVTENGIAKLLDMGLACRAEGGGDKGQAVGTPHYMSPEAARGEELDTRADMYSLGCTLFHMLTGKTPFSGDGGRSVMVKHVSEDMRDVRVVNPKVSIAASRVVAKLTAKDREKRHQTPDEAIQDLESLLKNERPKHAIPSARFQLATRSTGPRAPIGPRGTTGPNAPVGPRGTTGPNRPVPARHSTGPAVPVAGDVIGRRADLAQGRGTVPAMPKRSRGAGAAAASVAALVVIGIAVVMVSGESETESIRKPTSQKRVAQSQRKGVFSGRTDSANDRPVVPTKSPKEVTPKATQSSRTALPASQEVPSPSKPATVPPQERHTVGPVPAPEKPKAPEPERPAPQPSKESVVVDPKPPIPRKKEPGPRVEVLVGKALTAAKAGDYQEAAAVFKLPKSSIDGMDAVDREAVETRAEAYAGLAELKPKLIESIKGSSGKVKAAEIFSRKLPGKLISGDDRGLTIGDTSQKFSVSMTWKSLSLKELNRLATRLLDPVPSGIALGLGMFAYDCREDAIARAALKGLDHAAAVRVLKWVDARDKALQAKLRAERGRLAAEAFAEAEAAMRSSDFKVAEEKLKKIKAEWMNSDFAQQKADAITQMIETLELLRKNPAAFVPGNVALASNGTTVAGAGHGDQLIDGNTEKYTGGSGFASGSWPCQWTMTFQKPYLLRQIRMRLWDGHRRHYRYAIESSLDGRNFHPLVDRTKGDWRSWQTMDFSPRPIKVLRIKGVFNSANRGFHVIELEAYCQPPATPVTPKFPSDPPGEDKAPDGGVSEK